MNIPDEIWQKFVAAKVSSNSELGEILNSSKFEEYSNEILQISFLDKISWEKVQEKHNSILKQLKKDYKLTCKKIEFIPPPELSHLSATSKLVNIPAGIKNPLQTIYWTNRFLPSTKEEKPRMKILEAAEEAEQTCQPIYRILNQRTRELAGDEKNILTVEFDWRVRVGGNRGFRELLLPVFHPVFGIPYIPASSLKGAARAWAKNNGACQQVKDLLGMLDGQEASAAKVEFLDAFPTHPCLSIDIATPQWSWEGERVVKYQPEPHPLLSLEKAQFVIGLCATARGNQNDVNIVKSWLDKALDLGIGSRVSSGYGIRKFEQNQQQNSGNVRSYDFKLWTQGMYGVNPPTRDNYYVGTVEFRPTAVRGILRYWFRSVALGLYSPAKCKEIEADLFGTIEPQAKAGSILIQVKLVNEEHLENRPHYYEGTIIIKAVSSLHLDLAGKLLILASHLGGIGRGFRRPLHWNNPLGLRGCYWELADEFRLPFHPRETQQPEWLEFFEQLKKSFAKISSFNTPGRGSPGTVKPRYQDVLNTNARIYLVPCANLRHPSDRKINWLKDGVKTEVRGEALGVLYANNNYKGETEDRNGNITGGNRMVGGKREVPSYVLIKSNYYKSQNYQVATIFGVDEVNDRQLFGNSLPNAIEVWNSFLQTSS
ncbi:hypothetical protein NIES2119_22265 [[Phormidium ambiguum] IAM M-71]|uniref:CRISPR type III-associated protein domain-containing protein n=1 Tax=[Phormidium ambiguum] IAM M-71 TaxID=454136 RepID=A0A1U7IB82_9CYAN|nr:RAMP superfamily CRISPR-associated protein [Phormidium ambiguum]OKH33832.1 hypothetical protein NIES2119_22265 [Phormidium ambiguum IAM M-71]